MGNFKIKMYKYIDGILQVTLKEFDLIEDAIEHGIKELCHKFKIFDRDGCICHDSDNDCDTYA